MCNSLSNITIKLDKACISIFLIDVISRMKPIAVFLIKLEPINFILFRSLQLNSHYHKLKLFRCL